MKRRRESRGKERSAPVGLPDAPPLKEGSSEEDAAALVALFMRCADASGNGEVSMSEVTSILITIYGHYYHVWTHNPRFYSLLEVLR